MGEELINRQQLAVVIERLNRQLNNHDEFHATAKNLNKNLETHEKMFNSVRNLNIGLWSFLGGLAGGTVMLTIEIVLKLLKVF